MTLCFHTGKLPDTLTVIKTEEALDTLKVVSIGGFGHAVFVFDDMQGMETVELCGLAPAFAGEDISFFTNHALCQGKRIFNNYQQMLTEVKPDVAVISTRLDRIADVAMDAARAGCHLICEKPLALNSRKLLVLYEVVQRAGIKLSAMLSMRSEPQFVAARNLYQRGAIGDAVMVNARKSYKWGTRLEWFNSMETYGGTIGWVGIHALDMINYITHLDFTSVSAMGGNFSHSERQACDDNCGMLLELSNGGHATVGVDLFRPDAAETHGDDWVRIVGTEGIVEASGSARVCTLLGRNNTPETIALPVRPNIFETFLLSLIDGRASVLNATSAFMLTESCHCAQESLKRRVRVNIKNEWNI